MNKEKFYNTLLKNVIQIVTVALVAAIVSFFIWYLLFWFLTKEANASLWSLWYKIPFVFLGVITTIALIDVFLNAKECEN